MVEIASRPGAHPCVCARECGCADCQGAFATCIWPPRTDVITNLVAVHARTYPRHTALRERTAVETANIRQVPETSNK
eukprot:3251445-Pleurochrysis_carterae.AAC.2